MTSTEDDAELEIVSELGCDEDFVADVSETSPRSFGSDAFSRAALGTKRGVEFCGRHPFATGLFAILGLIGLAISMISFELDRNDAAESTVREERIEATVRDIQKSVQTRQPVKKISYPSFDGKWSTEKAMRVARASTESQVELLEFAEWFPLELAGRQTRVILAHGKVDICSACMTDLSLFVFESDEKKWSLIQNAIQFTYIPGQGVDTALADLQVWKIGPEQFGIAVPSHYGRGGESKTAIDLFAYVSNELINILGLQTEEEYVGSGDRNEMIEAGLWYETKLSITFDRSKETFGFYDMVSTLSDSRANRLTSVIVPFRSNRYPHPTMERMRHCSSIAPDIKVFSHEYCGPP